MAKPSAATKVTIIGHQYSDQTVQGKLYELAKMPHVKHVYGMPDLHMASPCPIGTSTEVDGHVYTRWIGDDIGCGVLLVKLRQAPGAVNPQQIQHDLQDFEKHQLSASEVRDFKSRFHVQEENHDAQLGSIGSGNHFAEVMKLDALNDTSFTDLDSNHLYLCVHTGSRDFGADTQRAHETAAARSATTADAAELTVLKVGTSAYEAFMKQHDACCNWARCSRRIVAERFCKVTGLQIEKELYDVTHNFVERDPSSNVCIHRKGTIPTNKGPAMIPGSRGTSSILVTAGKYSKHSLPHGAGRQIPRSEAKELFADQTFNDMLVTKAGSLVVCESESLLRSEHPDCYKDIDDIAGTLSTEFGVNVIAKFLPVVTLKTRN
eukprot:TRINITY_DN15711_c0_g1_i1.p1 TRINITY_DN15711_c0_g1~~TRINITY_DN15711_c0_g1_i1.p1  ORF type:complete len:377 (+),score=74.04 TRINITY_DN15711_c0_g1_i1:37-1167(+)